MHSIVDYHDWQTSVQQFRRTIQSVNITIRGFTVPSAGKFSLFALPKEQTLVGTGMLKKKCFFLCTESSTTGGDIGRIAPTRRI